MKQPVFIGALVAIALGLVVWRATRPLERGSPTTSSTSSSTSVETAPSTGAPPERGLPSSLAGVVTGDPGHPSARVVPTGVTSGTSIELGSAMLEAQKLDAVRAALAAGDPRRALAELESFDRVVRGGGVLKHEAALLRVEALSRASRRTDARALAYTLRDDPTFEPYQKRLEGLLADAGL